MITERLFANTLKINRPVEVPSKLVPGMKVQEWVTNHYRCPKCDTVHQLVTGESVDCECGLHIALDRNFLIIAGEEEAA